MTQRSFPSAPSLSGAVIVAIACTLGCSGHAAPAAGCTDGEEIPCTCDNGETSRSRCGDAACSCGETADAGAPDAGAAGLANDATTPAIPEASLDTPGDATHLDEKSPPTAAYAECAVKGSFGWPCTASKSGPDPSECTDPNYPVCFVGGQGSWCTASCATFGVCPHQIEEGGDAGCVPSTCNARGFCK